MKCIQILAILLWLFAGQTRAADLSTDIRTGASDPRAGDGNYLELGFSLGVINTPFYAMTADVEAGKYQLSGSLDVNFHYQYKAFFMEAFSQSLEQFTLGYNLADGERWALDLVALEQHEEISKDINDDLKGIKKRRADYMFGPRGTGYFGNYIVQLHALTDISETHGGQVYSLKLARHWQYKNWNFHGIISESYRSERVVDYYLSVQPEDATEKFYAFDADAGFTQTFEIGATYPLSQKWVFRGLLRHVELERQWVGSPLVVQSYGDLLMASFSYVF